jgi:hypothetical protein
MSQKHNCLTDKSFKIDFRNNKSGKTNRFQFFRICQSLNAQGPFRGTNIMVE